METVDIVVSIGATVIWIGIGIYGVICIRKWDKKFSELHDRLAKSIDNLEDSK